MPRATLQCCLVCTVPGANLWFKAELYFVYVTYVSSVSPHFLYPHASFQWPILSTAVEIMLIQGQSEFRAMCQCNFNKDDWLLYQAPFRASHAHWMGWRVWVLSDWKASCIKKIILTLAISFGLWTHLSLCFSLICTSAHFKYLCISSTLVIQNSLLFTRWKSHRFPSS